MRRTTVLLEESVERELKNAAQTKGVAMSSIVREALAEFARKEARKRSRSLRFFAIGRSGQDDVAERHEEILLREMRPHDGGVSRPTRRRRRS